MTHKGKGFLIGGDVEGSPVYWMAEGETLGREKHCQSCLSNYRTPTLAVNLKLITERFGLLRLRWRGPDRKPFSCYKVCF